MRRWFSLVLLGIVVYVFSAIILLPAPFAYQWAEDRLGALRLFGVRGTVWAGDSSRVLLKGKEVGASSWRYRPAALAEGRLEYRLDLRSGAQQGSVYIGAQWNGALTMHGRDFPVSLLTPMFGRLALPLGGTLEADLRELRIEQGVLVSGNGTIDWNRGVVGLDSPLELGSFRLLFEAMDAGIEGQVSDTDGPLGVNGTVTLRADGTYQLNLGLSLRDPANAQVAALLETLGDPDADGRTWVRLSGRVEL